MKQNQKDIYGVNNMMNDLENSIYSFKNIKQKEFNSLLKFLNFEIDSNSMTGQYDYYRMELVLKDVYIFIVESTYPHNADDNDKIGNILSHLKGYFLSINIDMERYVMLTSNVSAVAHLTLLEYYIITCKKLNNLDKVFNIFNAIYDKFSFSIYSGYSTQIKVSAYKMVNEYLINHIGRFKEGNTLNESIEDEKNKLLSYISKNVISNSEHPCLDLLVNFICKEEGRNKLINECLNSLVHENNIYAYISVGDFNRLDRFIKLIKNKVDEYEFLKPFIFELMLSGRGGLN